MGCTSLTVDHGPPALAALRATIDELQHGRPLAPVTVVVPSNSVGVGARRWLAAHGGVAAVQFVTLHRLAELLGGPVLAAAGRRPVSTPVVDVAVRRALVAEPGMFRPVAHHHATVTALREAHRELRHVPSAALDRLAHHGSARAADVVRLHRLVSAELGGRWYDEADLLASAAADLPVAPPPTVVHLPRRLRPTERAFLDALAHLGEVRSIVAGGAPGADAVESVELVDTSDADEEVREVVRRIVAAAADGTPLERMAVVWPVADPYARLVSEHLDAAAIPWNGRPGTMLHERLAARLVLDVLGVDRRGLRRVDLFGVLAHVPARTAAGRPVPAARWERVSRAAGLATGSDWDQRLVQYEHDQRAGGSAGEADAAAALGAFVADLRGLLGPPDRRSTWRHWAEVATALLERWLGGAWRIAHLPAVEHEAYAQVEAAIHRLGQLDELDDPVTRGVFADALAAELDAAPGRVGRIGDGVQCGPLSFAAGQALAQVFVVGAIEGQLPATPRPDPLLGDADRALTGGALVLSDELAAEQHDQLLAAIAAAAHCVVLRPRGDLRTTADRQPSRWLAELAAGAPVVEHSLASFAAGLAEARFPAVPGHHRVRALVHHCRTGQPIDTHPLAHDVVELRRGLATVRARESPELTAFDGNLTGLPIASPLDRPISPSRLELWAACPYAYFARHVLGVQPVEQPDAALRIRPTDQGVLVHEALDAFHRRVIAGELSQPGPHGWTPEHLAALYAELDAAGARMADAGRVGRHAAWLAGQVQLRNQLRSWLDDDGRRTAERDAVVLASELRFGTADDRLDAVAVALGDGRAVRLTGSIDRVDRGRDGTVYVADHKTGSRTRFGGISDADPTAGGAKLQLPAYAAAARAYVGADPQPAVRAEYSFLKDGSRLGATFPPGEWPAVGAALARIVDGIAAGLFPAFPARAQHRLPYVACEYCDPDHLGTAERYEELVRKSADPRLAAVLVIDVEDDQ